MNSSIEKYTKRSVSESLKVFHPSCNDNDYIEVTEWNNGEGWDIDINGKHISLHYDELDAINYLTNYLLYYHK